eukprot:5139894-Amphidinium_carterae.1
MKVTEQAWQHVCASDPPLRSRMVAFSHTSQAHIKVWLDFNHDHGKMDNSTIELNRCNPQGALESRVKQKPSYEDLT